VEEGGLVVGVVLEGGVMPYLTYNCAWIASNSFNALTHFYVVTTIVKNPTYSSIIGLFFSICYTVVLYMRRYVV
jgi:hypothetical protein